MKNLSNINDFLELKIPFNRIIKNARSKAKLDIPNIKDFKYSQNTLCKIKKQKRGA